MSNIGWIYKRGSDAVNYRLRSWAGGRFAAHCRPSTIIFLLTGHCNARCVHCDIWKNKECEDTPTPEQLKACLRDLRRWLGTAQVTFTGGEALMKPYTPELVEYASSMGLFVEVLTNGYWSDQSRVERLALARPWRVTISFDGMGATHDTIRGHSDFFARTSASIETLCRVRRQQNLRFSILLKTVIMEHNVGDLCAVAKFAGQNGLDVLYQPIEQNYATADDPEWFQSSENWPRDIAKVKEAVCELTELKRQGLPIANSYENLRAILDYFENPTELRLAVRSHVAPGKAAICSAITGFQIQPNGDVMTCTFRPAVGNIKRDSIREIWRNRTPYWITGCCRGKDAG